MIASPLFHEQDSLLLRRSDFNQVAISQRDMRLANPDSSRC